MITNIVLIFLITVCYEGALKKKIFVTLLVYGTNMGCDLVAVHLLTDYSITGKVGECAAYITVLLLLICDVISEKILIKNKGEDKTPHGMILAVISALCLAELLIVEQELKNRILLVLFGCCVLAVVLLIFYLYDVLISAYKKLEEQSLMEKQMLIYSHQLDVLMQSEEKVKALRHDMKIIWENLHLWLEIRIMKKFGNIYRTWGSICRTSLNWSAVGIRILTVC